MLREADEIKLQPLLTGHTCRAWRMSTIHVIIAAVDRQDDMAMDWVLMVERDLNRGV